MTEGVPDALAAATCGYRAVAVFGAGLPDDRVADRLANRRGLLVIAFDSDPPGRAASERLRALLDRREVLEVVPPVRDLNSWLIERGRDGLTRQLRLAIALPTAGRGIPACGRTMR
ncbi:MAG: toprim domain-containing protein [Acidimicrobiia bacterium]